MDGPTVLQAVNHAGDGASWEWVVIPLQDVVITTGLSLSIATGQPQYMLLVAS